MTSAPSTESELTPRIDSGAAATALADRLYDAEQERVVAKRLQGGRWRGLVMTAGAVCIAAAAAAGFTFSNYHMPTGNDAWAATPVAPQPAAAPSLASSSSVPVRLIQPDSDPNKRQERVSVTAPDSPADPAASRPNATPQNGQDTGSDGVRRISLSSGRVADAAPQPAASQPSAPAAAATATEMTMPLAPVPKPRPARAR
ncbi:hypothetical protein [Phreatobacter stygius]|uniref:Uncharacterized protein n=1 Tax=Phreatobacter stygius TaxID=1940610 RepID=A0A4D7BDH6_9HYPH|nr:hypothetical protein [Phreatobacter stygius]QCI68038.1 hypothetical protein E8M01_29710 [Phreatobacter stygius]